MASQEHCLAAESYILHGGVAPQTTSAPAERSARRPQRARATSRFPHEAALGSVRIRRASAAAAQAETTIPGIAPSRKTSPVLVESSSSRVARSALGETHRKRKPLPGRGRKRCAQNSADADVPESRRSRRTAAPSPRSPQSDVNKQRKSWLSAAAPKPLPFSLQCPSARLFLHHVNC